MKSYEIAANVFPTERQIKWQDMEFYAIIYYGLNTFTGREISDGFTVPEMFWPEDLNTDEWCELVKQANMSGMILTAKHFDGFCNWQTETTDYSVKSSSWLDGKGDLVRMAATSSLKYGLKFGLYLPVWDRHEKSFKDPKGSYNEFFIKQLTELVANYGKLFEIILDDRCDEDIPFDFDYKTVYKIIREYQPDCAITWRGPDARWVGNSKGVTRNEEWNSVPACYGYSEDGSVLYSKVKKKEGQMVLDLGGRSAIRGETDFIWSPCEVNYPMRPHWFYKKDDDMLSKTKDKLLKMYCKTVGGNQNLMLGLAPDKRGKFENTEKEILKSTGHDLKVIFGYNLLSEATVAASSELGDLYKADNLSADNDAFWSPKESDKNPEITVNFDEPKLFDKVVLKEHIRGGQHVEKFTVYVKKNNKWKKHSEGTVIGHKKICEEKPCETDSIKIVFTKYRKNIEISYLQIN